MRIIARAGAAAALAGVMALAAAGPAAAHFCYKDGNPNNGTNGKAWMTKAEWLGFIDSIEVVGVVDGSTVTVAECTSQVAAVKAAVTDLPDTVRFMGPALLAGGTFFTDRTPKNIGYTPIWLVSDDCILAFPGE